MSAKLKARREKESRWEMIRKKHLNCINVTSETVRKFLAMDFVTNEKGSGSGSSRRRLDPVVVMNIRHEMIKRKKRDENTPPVRENNPSKDPREKHEELTLIEKELNKFKSDIQKKLKESTPRISPSKMVQGNKTKKKRSILIKLNNSGLFESLQDAGERTKDFFETAIDAAQQCTKKTSSESTLPLDNADERPQEKAQSHNENTLNSVRFVDNIEVITYSREPSTITNLDDGYGDEQEEEEAEIVDDVESLIEDEEEFFGLTRQPETNDGYLDFTEKTVTTTTTTTTFQQFRYLSKDSSYLTASPNLSTTTEEAESTESSEVNFYQIFGDNDKPEEDNKEEESNELHASLTVKSFKNPNDHVDPPESHEDLVQEVIRVKAVSNVANRHRLLRNYFTKWMHYTTIQKITKDSNITTKSQRMTKIDAYLKKIREQKKLAKRDEKAAQSKVPTSKDTAIVMVKRYQSKLKLQQDIIEVQKLKLERQERMIAELRLSRLNEDAQKFKHDLREELRNAMRTGDVRLRAKAKCLQVVGDVVEEEENKFVAYGNMIPKFLAKMQERALERQMRHEQAKDRRLRLEHERDEQKMAIEEEKRKADEEAKRQRMQELQEKRRREKQEKLRKEQEREKFLEDTRKAKAFYRRCLLRLGMDRWKKLIHRKRTLELKVTNLRKKLKVKACFKAWFCYSRLQWQLKFDRAQDFYELYLQRMCLRVWKENLLMARGQLLVAVDWHEMKLNEKFFAVWLAHTREAKIAEETKMRHAEAHYKWHVLWKMLEHWQRLHSVLKLERETEERRQRWRHKIWELLPDYTPNVEP